MAYDEFKPRGRTQESKPDAGGGAIRSEPIFGIVKNNIDPTRAGRLQVYISDFGGSDPDDSDSWVTVGYMSPFYGVTQGSASDKKGDYGSYLQNPSSYGIWNSPPDIGTTVICIFINGDMNYGYYIGCVPKPEALQMVPAIGATTNVVTNDGEAQSYGGAVQLPVTNLNENNSAIADGAGFLDAAKPVHSYVASIYSQQGLIRDPIRGPITSSANRESPSRVGWGVSTPGRPIFEGGYDDETIKSSINEGDPTKLKVISRRGGHSIVMDDGDLVGRDQLIRIRTALGHQIMFSDNGQCINIMHSNGQSWIELGKEGTIDLYAMNSVNIRTQGDLNLHADNNVNIQAMKDLNIAATNINVNSEKDTQFRVGGNFSNYIIGKYTVKVDGAMSMASAGEGSYASSSTMYINGSRVNLNTGSASTTPAEVKPIPVVAHTDTLYDSVKGYAAAPGKLLSITSRAPAHAPWANANQGVDVKVTNNASSELPTAPNPSLASANELTSTAPENPVTTSVAATIPSTSAISATLDKNVTATMVGSVAKQAASVAPNVVATGAGTITDAAGKTVAAAGSLAQTATQLVSGNVLKPGADKLINGLVSQGGNVQSAMTNNLFTGKPGAENLPAFTQNIVAQVNVQVTNFQKAQSGLTQTGVMTGTEAPAQVAGLVTAGAQVGIAAATDFVKNSTNALPGQLAGTASAVTNAMSAGNFAAKMATTVTGGLGSIAGALNGMGNSLAGGPASLLNSVKGVAGSAFSAITSAFKPLKSGVPQNLTFIAEKNAAEVAEKANRTSSNLPSVPTASSVLNSAVSTVTSTVNNITSGITSGISALPGGQSAISAVVNKANGALNNIPGVSAVTALAKTTSSAVNNGISTITSLGSSLTNSTTGPNGSLASSFSNALSNQAGQLANTLKSGASKLSSIAIAGLPVGAASQLSAAINSLSSSGPVQIKLPTVATNTVDRTEVSAQVKSTLGSSKIPTPNFSGKTDFDAQLRELSEKQARRQELYAQIETQKQLVLKIRDDYQAAIDNYPAGDPAIVEQREKYFGEKKKWAELINQLAEA